VIYYFLIAVAGVALIALLLILGIATLAAVYPKNLS
jgi:hypothetical protein